MEGKALIIAGVEEDIDPMLTPVLEKQVCWGVDRIACRTPKCPHFGIA